MQAALSSCIGNLPVPPTLTARMSAMKTAMPVVSARRCLPEPISR